MTVHTLGVIGLDRFRSYLRLTQKKLLVWGIFLIPYVAVMIFYSGALPHWLQVRIQEVIYTSSLSLAKVFPTPNPRLGATQVSIGANDPEQLTIGYFLATYLWSCILVESFGILLGSRSRG